MKSSGASALRFSGKMAEPKRITYILGEGTSEKRSHDRGNTEHRTKRSLVHWPFGERDDVNHDDYDPVRHTGCTQACNRASDNKACRGRSGATNGGPKFENGDKGQEDPFGGIESVHAAEKEHEGRRREHVRTPIPLNF